MRLGPVVSANTCLDSGFGCIGSLGVFGGLGFGGFGFKDLGACILEYPETPDPKPYNPQP